ncbi:SDR family oxidoreductase [Kytococcus sedentarius]|uniref:SDR family oxidoreductase n=1 Tax=Kytococcus sedentarius TaxID=1276 RepID=UPI0035BBF6F7
MSRTYVITGAGSGIGATTARLLREAGHTVIGVDLKGAEVTADLGTPEGREQAVADTLSAAGNGIDAVIAAAGVSAPAAITARVNYFGVTEFLERLRPELARSRAPRAVVVSSMSSLQPNHPDLVDALLSGDETRSVEIADQLAADERTTSLIYASSKRAISRWVRRESVTDDWAGAHIPLNAVAPGTVLTPMTEELLSTPEGRALVDAVVPMPLNSHQQAESIATLCVWLASAENSHCAGQTIYCDGGADVVLRGEDAWSWADQAVGEKFTEIMGRLRG